MKGYFITGTDTNVGKTCIAIGILTLLKKYGFNTTALKPISTGCIKTKKGLRNRDAIILQKSITQSIPYSKINPISFFPPIAPNIAAEKANYNLCVSGIIAACENTLAIPSDFIIIEGAGGFLVPLNTKETMAHLAKSLGYPLILVVGIRLGCLNHTLLTLSAIQSMSIPLVGWIANVVTPSMSFLMENIETLIKQIDAPLLGIIPYQEKVNYAFIADQLELTFPSLF